ncbi:MAG TPA: SDR family NAD(P)-dependent oxidoreductase [Vicinamibacterales bacterium]|nr:SDR family NAD(P)-dependent oxidoreductase [Vicinamibacterales bacterium]
MRFSGKVCVVSGGGSGIGRAACERFATEGGRVVVVDLSEQDGRETAEHICANGGQALFARADVSNAAQVKAAFDAAVARWQRVDVIVNDAAMMTFKPILELDESDWDKVMAVNLRSLFLFCRYGVPHMPAGSAIVNISSVHAHETTRNVVPYATSKGGVEAFTRGFSEELADRKIRINAVAPGAVNTPMLWNNPNVKSGAEKITGAVGEPEDIAAAICFLASSEARFITGTTLVVDGGRLDILP